MNWYYVEEGKQAGPISDEQLDDKFRGGTVKAETLIWREGMADWVPYSQVRSGMVPAGTGGEIKPEAVCAECGKIFPVDEMIRYGDARVCAGCKPLFLQKVQEGAALSPGGVHYAGFWIRFAARFLDGLIIAVPLAILMVIVMVWMFHGMAARRPDAMAALLPQLILLFIEAGFFFVAMAYEIFCLGKYGATLGKMACKIHVVTSEGGPISYARATGRFFSVLLSRMICCIGFIIAAFDGQKRALHDHICNTRVIYK